MQNNKQSDEEIVNFLVNSGYEESVIRKALEMTKSRDSDEIVDVISQIESKKTDCRVSQIKKEEPKFDREEAQKLLEANKKTILADKQYREELIRRINEERKLNTEEEVEIAPDILKTESKADCVFNIRFPNASNVRLFFSKDNTLDDLFSKIEEVYGSSNFVLYKMRDSNAIERTTEKLQNVKKIYPKAALYIE